MTKAASRDVLPHLLHEAFPLHWGDPTVQDIFVNRAGAYWVRTREGKTEVPSSRMTPRTVRAIATHAAQLRGQRFDETSPLLDCELPNKERLAAVMHPCTPDETPLLALRRGSAELPTLEELEAQGLFDLLKDRARSPGVTERTQRSGLEALRDQGNIVAFLRHAIACNMTVGFVGPTSSGKTHDMKAMLMALHRMRRTLFVGDTNEVPDNTPLRDFGILLAGKHSEIPQAKLIAQTLRMAPELLCVLETRDGDAAWALYRALASGHQGMTSWHAPSANQALHTMAAMMHENPSSHGMSVTDIVERLRVLFHVIVSVVRLPDGMFRATDIRFADECGA